MVDLVVAIVAVGGVDIVGGAGFKELLLWVWLAIAVGSVVAIMNWES